MIAKPFKYTEPISNQVAMSLLMSRGQTQDFLNAFQGNFEWGLVPVIIHFGEWIISGSARLELFANTIDLRIHVDNIKYDEPKRIGEQED